MDFFGLLNKTFKKKLNFKFFKKKLQNFKLFLKQEKIVFK